MPDDWKEVCLGDVIELKRGYDLPQQQRRHGSVPIVSSSGITDYHEESMAKGPGVVTGRYGTLGQVFFIAQDFWPLNTTLYVRDFKGNDPRFISYFLRSVDFLSFSDKAAVPGLNRNHLHMARVRLPSNVGEQQAIAEVLSTLDNKIELNHKIAHGLEAIVQTMFKSWFVDFHPVHCKIERQWIHGQSLPGLPSYLFELFPEAFVESEVGEIPEGWKLNPLKQIASVLMGQSPKGDSYNAEGTGTPLINGPVEFGEYFPVKTKWTTSPTKLSEQGDLILCVRGSTTGKHIKADGVYCLGRGVCAIRPSANAHSFTYQTVKHGLSRLLSKTTGSVFPNLSGPDIAHFEILMPPKELIEAFGGITVNLVERIELAIRESETLLALREGLLPKLISGEIRVKDAERLVGSIV